MKATSFGALAAVAVLQASLAVAQTSLYVPGFDPQALSVQVEGVDAQGRTTYLIGPGAASGTFDADDGLIGTATLVADATEAHIVYVDTLASLSVSEDCQVANGQAVCSGVVSAEGAVQTVVVTESATPFAVQVGSATAVPSAGSGVASGSTPTATAGSGASSGVSATSSAAPTTSSGAGNGVGKTGASMVGALGVAGLLSAFFL
ncbi:uncharacterized protein TRAVEDRAFT_70670 [Trametes versicolor FP-101664 SS1]|uniref:uncharacterized protein n=1 Tax=Trametes versicolor (strain FP-101664) TaxID=717944 RepID=UPI000462256F|nr:uncharacterized protein TRAVEDRAFT_70670 [Trametes versicolor FP-101664 SS1]EIW60219.1 hypothetical protein TRAVEDRAFT_70670 [Trametes versicolor FP-101664 SS1]